VDALLPEAQPIPVGKRIEARLTELGRAASWLADRAKLERSTVTRIVRGERTPSARTLRAIAPALEMTVERLVLGTDAAEVVKAPPDMVSSGHLDQAVREVIEYERKAMDLASRLREATEDAKQQRERRAAAEDKLAAAEQARDEANAAARRYADALDLAVTDLALLRTQQEQLVAEAKKGHWTSHVAAGLAGIAAVASVASYLTRAAARADAQDAASNETSGSETCDE
jgi:transcriptional regulator with XRE-family HTH domain